MIKNTIALCLVFFSLNVLILAREELPIISDIYFIKSQAKTSSSPPLIRIGIDMAANAYYKLSQEGNIVAAGLFPKGFNSVSIPTASLLEQRGEHVYLLELKTPSGLIQKEIVLDVQLLTATEKADVKSDISEHKLSLYVDDQLVASRTKKVESRIKVTTKLPPLPQNYDPSKPDLTSNPLTNSVSILDAIGLAYHLIKSAAKKKDQGNLVSPIQKTNVIALTFSRPNPQGGEEVRALIRLKIR